MVELGGWEEHGHVKPRHSPLTVGGNVCLYSFKTHGGLQGLEFRVCLFRLHNSRGTSPPLSHPAPRSSHYLNYSPAYPSGKDSTYESSFQEACLERLFKGESSKHAYSKGTREWCRLPSPLGFPFPVRCTDEGQGLVPCERDTSEPAGVGWAAAADVLIQSTFPSLSKTFPYFSLSFFFLFLHHFLLQEEKGVDPMLVGFFIFVVCGSAIFSLLNSAITGQPE